MVGKAVRRGFHALAGALFPLLAFFFPWELVTLALAISTVLFLSGELARGYLPPVRQAILAFVSHFFKESFFKGREAARFVGSTYFLAGSLLTFALFDKGIAISAVLFAAVGDPAAATVGEAWGQRKFFGKSLEGSLAFLVACLVVAGLIHLTAVSPGLKLLALGALVATVTEWLPLPVDDNFTVPLVAGGVMALAAQLLL